MDTSATPPPEKNDDSPSPFVTPAAAPLTSPQDPDFMPPPIGKSSNMRYVWLVVIFGLVISVLGVGAYIIAAETKKVPSQVSTLLTPTPNIPKSVSTPTLVANPTSILLTETWKVYKDSENGFQIKYPEDKITIDKNGPGNLSFAKIVDIDTDFRNRNYQFNIYRQKRSIEAIGVCCEKITVNNTSGYKNTEENDLIQYYLISNNPDETFDIRLYLYSESVPNEDIKIFEQMIQTFQLLK